MASTTTQWILELVDHLTPPMKGVKDASDKAAKSVDAIGEKAENTSKKLKGMSAMDMFAVSQSVDQLAQQFDKAMAPGIAFNSSVKDLQALTGISGDALDELGDKARKLGKDFGVGATGMMESEKGILSRFGPDIAKNGDALDEMGKDVATLSKTMGNDTTGAMDALTTSMLQFQVDLKNPQDAASEMTRMMNVMAASAKEGASEVIQTSEAIKVAGVEASNQKVSFEETNAAIQALAQGGKYGAEAGTALRNVLSKMSGIDIIPKEAAAKLEALGVNYDIVSNKSLPFTTRLRELKKAQGDATIMAQIFGVENAAAAQILLRSADYQDEMTQKITGTNVATEQATIVMSSYAEWVNRTKAWVSDLGISVFNVAGGMLPFVDGMAGAVSIMANMANAKQGVGMLFDMFKEMPMIGGLVSGAFGMMSTASTIFSATVMGIPGFGWILAAATALAGAGGLVYALQRATDVQSGFNKTLQQSTKLLDDDFYALRKTKEGTSERKKEIEEINSKYGQYLTNLLTEKSSLEDIAKAQDEATQGMARNIALKTQQEKIGKIISDSMVDVEKSFNDVGALIASQYSDKSVGLRVAGEASPAIQKILDGIKKNPSDGTGINDLAKQYGLNAYDVYELFVPAKEAIMKQNAQVSKVNAFFNGYLGSSNGLKINSGTGKNPDPKLTVDDLSSKTTGLSGNGTGSIKNISQKIDQKLYFTMNNDMNVDAIVEKVVRKINDSLRDGLIAAV